MSSIITEVGKQYNVSVFSWEEGSLGYGLETNRGNAFLYTVPEPLLPKVSMVRQVYEKIGGTKMVLPIIPNRDGEEIVQLSTGPHYLTAWPQLETEIIDYAYLGHSLASFHLRTGKKLGHLQSKYTGWGTWQRDWSNQVKKLERFRRNAQKRLEREEANDFDAFLVDNYGHFQYLGAKAVAYLEEANYREVVKKSRDAGGIGYSTFGFDQFVATPQKNLYFVDPFSWVEDMRARDIAQFIKADVQEYGWNPYHIHAFLTAYHKKGQIMPEEFAVIYANFMYPGRLLKKLEVLNQQKPSLLSSLEPARELEPFDARLEDYTPSVAYEELRRNEALLREFPRYVKNAFGVVITSIYK